MTDIDRRAIPDEAIEAACNAYEAAVLDETPRDSDDLSNHEEIAAVRAAAPYIVAAELESLEAWCTEHAARLPGPEGQNDARRTPATDAVWDVIDEIRRRRGGAS